MKKLAKCNEYYMRTYTLIGFMRKNLKERTYFRIRKKNKINAAIKQRDNIKM